MPDPLVAESEGDISGLTVTQVAHIFQIDKLSDVAVDDSADQTLRRAKSGDQDALRELLLLHGLEIAKSLQIAPKWQSLIDVDDVLQVTYLDAALHIGDLAANTIEGFYGWLRRIAHNNLNDAIREQGREKRGRDRIVDPNDDSSYDRFLDRVSGTTTTPTRTVRLAETRSRVQNVLNALPPDYERVLRLYEMEGRSIFEIAEIISRSQGAVKMLLARARERFVDLFGASSYPLSS